MGIMNGMSATGNETMKERSGDASGSMPEPLNKKVGELYARLAERFNIPAYEIEEWPDALQVSLEIYGDGEGFQLLLDGVKYGAGRVRWMELFWDNLFKQFPPDCHPDRFDSVEGEAYISWLLEEHFERVSMIFFYARYISDTAFMKFNEAFTELLEEATVQARVSFSTCFPDPIEVSAAMVETIRKDGKQALTRRLGLRVQGKPPKIAPEERDDFIMRALVAAEKDNSPRSQSWVANHLGVSERTLRDWCGIWGWELTCNILLEKAWQQGLISAEGADRK